MLHLYQMLFLFDLEGAKFRLRSHYLSIRYTYWAVETQLLCFINQPSDGALTKPKQRARWGPAKPKNNSGKACGNNIVNNRYCANRKTHNGD